MKSFISYFFTFCEIGWDSCKSKKLLSVECESSRWREIHYILVGSFTLQSGILIMVEATRLKDFVAKVKSVLVVMDQKEEWFKLLKQSITSISSFVEAQQAKGFVSSPQMLP